MVIIRKVLDNTIKSHYVLITDLSKLLSSQNKLHRKVSYCRRYLQHFYTIEKLNDHMINCNKMDPQNTIFSDNKDIFIKFKNFKNKIPVPFVVNGDFESLNTTCIKTDEIKSTEKIADQNICSYANKLVCTFNDKFSKPLKLYRGEYAGYTFIEDMLKEENYCYRVIKKHFNKKIIMTEEDEENFKNEKSINVIFVIKNIRLIIINKLEIIIILQVNIWAVLIECNTKFTYEKI